VPTEYEFNEAENTVMRSLATTTQLVGVTNLVSFVLATITVVLTIAKTRHEGAQMVGAFIGGFLVLGIFGVYNIVTAFWMFRSAAAFRRVFETQGNDIPNVVEALSYQRSFFGLMKILTIVCGVLLFGACCLAFAGGMAATSRH